MLAKGLVVGSKELHRIGSSTGFDDRVRGTETRTYAEKAIGSFVLHWNIMGSDAVHM